MCDFFSGILTKDGTVLTDDSDSHSEILNLNKLKDDKPVEQLDFYPFEIRPKEGKTFYDKPIKKNWTFGYTASGGHSDGFIPKWNTEKHEKAAWSAFAKSWKRRVIDRKELKTLSGRGFFVRNSKIGKISNCEIRRLDGSAIVKSMRGSAIVESMCDSAIVKSMCDSAIVKSMWGSAIVESMWGSAIVKSMWGSAIVKSMWGSAIVKSMDGSAIVKSMRGSAIVKSMRDSAVVESMEGKYATVRRFGKYAKVVTHSAGVIIDFTGEKTEVSVK